MKLHAEKKRSLLKRKRHREKPLYHEDVRTILLQALPTLVLSGLGSLAAGIILQGYLDYVYLVPGILILVPALMNLKGAIASSVAARMGTAYHLGFLKGKNFFGEARENFLGAILLALLLSVSSAVFAFFVCQAFGLNSISLPGFLFISVASGLAGMLLLAALTIALVSFSIRAGADPNNVSFPLVSTFGDFLMVGVVYLVMVLFIKLGGA
jgi:mgtE-like transporter